MPSARCCVALLTLTACVADSADAPRPDAGVDADLGIDADIDAEVPDVEARAVAAGGSSSAAVFADGTLRVWGSLGSPDGRPSLLDARTDWTAAAVSTTGLCALRAGRLYCLEDGFLARVGDSSDWSAVSVGAGHACGLRGGAAFCWGDNTSGQAGGEGDAVRDPRRIGEAGEWTAIAAGARQTCGVRAGGLYCWGELPGGVVRAPLRIGDGGEWTAVAVGARVCGLRAGQLTCTVDGGVEIIGADRDWTAVSAGDGFVCAGKASGVVACVGAGGFGQLGVGDQLGGSELRPVTGAFAAFAAGDAHVCALGADGALSCWGRNHAGQLGDGHPPARRTPTPIGSAHDWSQVSHSAGHVCALRGSALHCWGDNSFGQLGVGDVAWASRPRLVEHDWSSVAAGVDHTCGVRDNGTLWCWGANGSGQLGQVGDGDPRRPLQVGSASTWIEVAAGAQASCARRADGGLWCWGDNSSGQLGVGSAEPSVATPTRVGLDADWSQVSVGAGLTCGRRGGTITCAGGVYGSSMGPVDAGLDWTAIAVRGGSACARKAPGAAFCWTAGEALSSIDGDDWSYADPRCGLRRGGAWCGLHPPAAIAVPGSSGWTAVESSGVSQCGLAADRGLHCWGDGATGVTGQGDAWRLRPVPVAD